MIVDIQINGRCLITISFIFYLLFKFSKFNKENTITSNPIVMKALVIGATGATGKDLVNQLLNDKAFEEVDIFVRKPVDIENERLKVHVVNFEKPEEWKGMVKGDVIFLL